jgi:hypothetical protein
MNRKNEIDELAGIKTRLTKLQTQSNKLKNNLFDYIEGLESVYNVFSNYNRDDFSFEIYGNKLKLKATYNDNESTFQGVFSVYVLSSDVYRDKFSELLSWKFDNYGNIKNANENYVFSVDDFAESFYIELMNKLIDSNKFEL